MDYKRKLQLFLVCLSAVVNIIASQACDSANGWVAHLGSCYYMSNYAAQTEYNWHQAREFCLQNGAELASIQSEADQNFIFELAEDLQYRGHVWIGLNNLKDRDRDFEWSNGESLSYNGWAERQPSTDGLEKCAFSMTAEATGCFEFFEKVSLTEGIVNNPQNPTFGCENLGYYPNADYNACLEKCIEVNCETFTFYDNEEERLQFKGECLGCTKEVIGENKVSYENAHSGISRDCPPLDHKVWYSANCGMKKGFVCKKDPNVSVPGTVPPTDLVPGYCPEGYWGFSNKCYKLVPYNYPEGVSWNEALQRCRSEPGIQPDLASIDSAEEQAAIVARLTEKTWGYWIGFSREGGTWVWTDNADTRYTNWDDGVTDAQGNCAELRTYPGPVGNWNKLFANDARGYICQVYKDVNNIHWTPGISLPDFDCPDGYEAYWYGCYRLNIVPQSFRSADQHCRAINGHLASVHDPAENAYIYSLGLNEWPLWIGLEKIDEEYKWLDGWPDIYTNWGANEPANGQGCIAMEKDGKWNDTQCEEPYPFVCKIPKVDVPTTPAPVDGVCPDGGWEEWGGYCFYFATDSAPDYDSRTWDNAHAACKERAGNNHPNSGLASVHNMVENDWIYKKLKEKGLLYTKSAWIGMSKANKDAPWTWLDGSAANYFAWAPGEPNDVDGTELCVEMYVDAWPGLWNDHTCSEARPYVCMAEKAPPPTTPTMPTQGPGDCPSMEWTHYGDSCFLFRPDEYTDWGESVNECAKLGAHLATLRDSAENWFVWQKLVETTNMPTLRGAWFGLSRKTVDSEWTWRDGQAYDYTNWAPGEPNGSTDEEGCVEMYTTSGEWNDHFCTDLRGYVCKYKKVLPTTVTSPSSTQQTTPTSTPKPTPTEGNPDAPKKPSAGAVVGIVIGTLVLTTVLGVAGYLGFLYYRKKQIPEVLRGFTNSNYDNFENDA